MGIVSRTVVERFHVNSLGCPNPRPVESYALIRDFAPDSRSSADGGAEWEGRHRLDLGSHFERPWTLYGGIRGRYRYEMELMRTDTVSISFAIAARGEHV